MMITASPDAASIPAVMATWWPKFLENWISLNRGSLQLAAWRQLVRRVPAAVIDHDDLGWPVELGHDLLQPFDKSQGARSPRCTAG